MRDVVPARDQYRETLLDPIISSVLDSLYPVSGGLGESPQSIGV